MNLPENTAFTYCLSKAAIHFNIKFDDLIKFYLAVIYFKFNKCLCEAYTYFSKRWTKVKCYFY